MIRMILKQSSQNKHKKSGPKVISLVLISALFCSVQPMSAQVLPDGRTTQNPQDVREEKPYDYIPVDVDFWEKIEDHIAYKRYTEMISAGLGVAEEMGVDSDEGLEGMLAAAMGLRLHNISYASSLLLREIIKKRLNTELAQKALYELDLIAQNFYYDPVEISDDLLNSNEFGQLHPDVQNFVSFHIGLSDLINGYRIWASKELKKVKYESYWGQKITYQKALNEVSQGKLDEAEARFSQLTQLPTVHPNIKKRSQLQIARISFERKDFKKASNIYRDLRDFHVREKGRILLERAWSLYYLKEYSEALGILKALKSPYFEVSSTPERFILEMIIFKQLCYYDTVSQSAREYYDFYAPALGAIKKRKKLNVEATVARMALMNFQIQEQANFINQLRDELDLMVELDINDYKFFKDYPRLYREKDKEVQQRLNHEMERFFPQILDDILDSEEQVKFLDYTAKIDALRIIRRGEDRSYESEKINYVQFDKIFWPVEDEYWLDEYDDFKLLIRSQCDQTLPSSSEDSDLIKQFGEEFK